MEKILQLIISFLGGGILVALINWARVARSERTTRQHEFFKEQVAKVYGPLYFFVGLNEALFELSGKFHKAYNEHFVGQNWSADPHTRETLNRETNATLEIANHYVNLCRDNNAKIVSLLRDNYAHIDSEDTDIFQQCIIDHLRMEREFKVEQPLETPLQIYLKVGEISFFRKEFAELVKRRFVEKNNVIKSTQ
jgi:hypothetical protein